MAGYRREQLEQMDRSELVTLILAMQEQTALLSAQVEQLNQSMESLIEQIPDMEIDWISDEKTRQRTLTQDVKSGSHEVLLGIITTLYRKREEISGSGRKFHSSDEHILNEAEKQVHREFGYVLGMDPEKVPDYIHDKLMKMDQKRA